MLQYAILKEIMQIYPPTLVIRHRRENLKKCSLRGLESRSDCLFIRYPFDHLPNLEQHFLLVMDGAEELSTYDCDRGLILLDSTWRYLPKMVKAVQSGKHIQKRILPKIYKTAYPRRQDDCSDPERGLSSLEAMYIAYTILNRSTDGLLDSYFWRDRFLELNALTFSRFKT